MTLFLEGDRSSVCDIEYSLDDCVSCLKEIVPVCVCDIDYSLDDCVNCLKEIVTVCVA